MMAGGEGRDNPGIPGSMEEKVLKGADEFFVDPR
jgi:hypothetical protein